MAQQGILSLSIKDRQALYKSYMPFVSGGGLFVPSTKRFSLGDEVFLLPSSDLFRRQERMRSFTRRFNAVPGISRQQQ